MKHIPLYHFMSPVSHKSRMLLGINLTELSQESNVILRVQSEVWYAIKKLRNTLDSHPESIA